MEACASGPEMQHDACGQPAMQQSAQGPGGKQSHRLGNAALPTSSDLLGGSCSGFFGASQMAKYGNSAKMPVAKEAVMNGHAGICRDNELVNRTCLQQRLTGRAQQDNE